MILLVKVQELSLMIPEGKPATNYIVTIEIIQNNCQQFSPFRLDLCGYGNGTTNAIIMQLACIIQTSLLDLAQHHFYQRKM